MKKQLSITVYTDSRNCDDPNDNIVYMSKINEALRGNFKEYNLEFEVIDAPHIEQYELYMPDNEMDTVKEELSELLSEAWGATCNGE